LEINDSLYVGKLGKNSGNNHTAHGGPLLLHTSLEKDGRVFNIGKSISRSETGVSERGLKNWARNIVMPVAFWLNAGAKYSKFAQCVRNYGGGLTA
jgi:hypothetical protein